MLELIGYLFISIFGCFFHFLFNWLHCNKYSAYFFATNESTWEHLKLIVIPSFLWILIEVPIIGNNPNFLFSKCISLILSMIILIILFYGYLLIFKNNNAPYNIFIFFLSVAIGQYVGNLILYMNPVNYVINYVSLIILILIFICFLIFTYTPLYNFLFKDPISKRYGIICKNK